MSLAGLVVFARGPRDFLQTEGLRKFWIVLACILFHIDGERFRFHRL